MIEKKGCFGSNFMNGCGLFRQRVTFFFFFNPIGLYAVFLSSNIKAIRTSGNKIPSLRGEKSISLFSCFETSHVIEHTCQKVFQD